MQTVTHTLLASGGTAELLSRIQFGLTAAFHVIFPAVTVGLSMLLAVLYGAYWRTGKQVYLDAFHFWRRIFGIGFAIGVVAGIVMTFEFGLNWSNFAYKAGPIIAPIIGWEVLTAFFLEAGFIGILLYGEGRVRHGVMFLSACMVALGTLLSTTWILAANSWMQTPAGFEEVAGQYRPTNWWHVVFNPSFDFRFAHMFFGALTSASLLVAGIGAYWARKGQTSEVARLSLRLGLAAACVLVPVQSYLGSMNATQMFGRNQGLLAAAQGHWDSNSTAWYQILLPNPGGDPPVVAYGFPKLGAYFLNNDPSMTEPVPGMDEVPEDERPNMYIVFYAFHVMLWGAMLMFGMTIAATVLQWRRRLVESRRFLAILQWMAPLGVAAVIGGWVTAEAGRQPWVIEGQLRTEDALSHLSTDAVALTVTVFVGTYLTLLTLFVRFVRNTVREGPHAA